MYRRLGICRLITQILSQFIKFNIALKFRLSIIKLPLYTAIIYRDPVKKKRGNGPYTMLQIRIHPGEDTKMCRLCVPYSKLS